MGFPAAARLRNKGIAAQFVFSDFCTYNVGRNFGPTYASTCQSHLSSIRAVHQRSSLCTAFPTPATSRAPKLKSAEFTKRPIGSGGFMHFGKLGSPASSCMQIICYNRKLALISSFKNTYRSKDSNFYAVIFPDNKRSTCDHPNYVIFMFPKCDYVSLDAIPVLFSISGK